MLLIHRVYERTLQAVTSLPSLDFGHSPIDADALVQWLSECPSRQSVRVYLPSRATGGSSIRLQRTLQSLGCIVTCRISSLRNT